MIKDNIKTWLKRSGREREWLGQQLGVSKKTVDNWLSIQDIPDGKMRLIERLMADDMAEDARRKQLSEPTNQVFSVEVDLIRFRRYNAAANAEGLLMHEWTVKTLDAAVDRISATIGLRTSMTNSAPIYRVSEPPSVNSATEIAKEAPKATDTPPGFIAMPVAVTEEEKVIIEEAARRQKQQSAKQPGSAGSQSHTSRKPSPRK